MKGILVLILAAAVGYAAYQYVYPIIADSMKFEKHKPKDEQVAAAPKAEAKKEEAVAPPKPMEEEKPAMEAPKPAPVAEAPKPAAPVRKPGEFVPPEFPPVEATTQNWTAIPKSAFPRQVVIKKDMNVPMKMGSATAATQVKAGGKLFAVGQEGSDILVSPSETSNMRGKVSLDDTNLKELLTQTYEQWKITRTETLRREHEMRLAQAEQAKNAPPASQMAAANAAAAAAAANLPNEKPARDRDGSYPLLIASIKAGKVTEIKPDAIKEWGEPQMADGMWKVNVKYETQTMFGKFDTEAQAQIRGGKVERWIYTNSGEEVP